MKNRDKYVDVILPLSVKGTFTYFTDQDLDIGQRVVVQFGLRKLYTAVVKNIHSKKPEDYQVKPLLAIIDEPPIVNVFQLNFWDWMADYYMCNIGDVMNAALPSSLKLSSESKIVIHDQFDGDLEILSKDEIKIVNILSDEEILSITVLLKLIKVKNIFSFINEMIRKEIIQIKEELHDKFKEKRIRILSFIGSEKQLDNVKLTEKQNNFIDAFLSLKERYPKKQWIVSDVLKKTQFTRAVLNALVKKGLFQISEKSVSRLLQNNTQQNIETNLVDFQIKAFKQIKESFLQKDVCLLHGVTSSGKTELYIKLIEEQLEKGNQVLYLLPEIALTTQIIMRLRLHFGNKVGVTHSSLNNSERVEIWKAVQNTNENIYFPIMLGARSSLLLPYSNLGLIIVDEEHDSSFKQHQPSPRYHARDAAIYLGTLHNAKVLLGSATPSAETYYNAKTKKYGLVEMHDRYSGISLPKLEIIDIRKAYLKKQMVHQFSPKMIDLISETLDDKKQVILFHNQRGYSRIISCKACSFTPSCNQCDVSLTYHKLHDHLRCHYCGYTEKLTETCPSCSSVDFDDKGFGTQQIEESIKELFPVSSVKRMDYDTTRRKNAYQQIIDDFSNGKIDILIGTQMIAKGLDFDNVSLVGVLNADSMLKFPDFRAYERAFSLMMQVGGRAGRKKNQGKVLVQTYEESNEIFSLLKKHDYNTFISDQIKERKLFKYPPYNRLILVTLKHKDRSQVNKFSQLLSSRMRTIFGSRVLGPEFPFISRIRNYYHKNILLKIETESSVVKAKELLSQLVENLRVLRDFRSVRVIIDVDPI